MKYLLCLLCCLSLLNCQDKSTPPAHPPTKEEIKNPDIDTSEEARLFKQIETSAKALEAKATEKTDIELAEKLVEDSKRYADMFRKNKKTPGILFRAGEVTRSIGHPEDAINVFRRLYTQFPTSDFAVKAQFMEASTFEDDLKDKEKAKKTYEEVIKKFPKDQLAEQARQLLKVIDKTPEELIKEFEKNK